MKSKTILILIYLIVSAIFIQKTAAQSIPLSIKGKILDSATNEPISFASISLVNAGKNEQSVISNANGEFQLTAGVIAGNVLLIRCIGYKEKSFPIVPPGVGNSIQLLPILLQIQVGNLAEVPVKGRKKSIRQEVDRLSYNVKDDPESKTANALEIFRKVPMVGIDNHDALEVNGRQSYVILLNGNPSSLVDKDPASFLRNQQATNIDRIEVITTPASKYSQNGVTEVINIITKKGSVQGLQANTRATYNSLNYLTGNLSADLKKDWFGLSLYNSFLNSSPPQLSSGYTVSPLISNTDAVEQKGTSKRYSNSLTTLPEISVELDSINLFIASLEYRRSPGNSRDNYNSFTTDANNLSSDLQSTGRSVYLNKSISYSAYYQHQGKKDKNRMFSFGYKFSGPKRSVYDEIDRTLGYSRFQLNQLNELSTSEKTLQADYANPIGDLNIEVGAKQIWRSNDSYGLTSINNIPPGVTSVLQDRQTASIIYNTYYLKKEKWGIKAGLRYERTTLDNDQRSANFNNLVPTTNLQLQTTFATLSLNYDQDIDRPALYQLNNFLNQANPGINSQGNPDLKPSIRHKVEFAVGLDNKSYMRFTAYYYGSKRETSSYLTRLDDNTNVLTYYNAGKKDELGLKFNTSVKLSKAFDINFNSRVSYVNYNSFLNNIDYKNAGTEFFVISNFTYLLPNNWRAGVYLRASNPYIETLGKGFWWTDHSLSVNKRFLKNALNFTLSTDNPFLKYRNRSSSAQTNDYMALRKSSEVIRSINIGLSYRIGSLKYQIKRNSKQISNSDQKTEQQF